MSASAGVFFLVFCGVDLMVRFVRLGVALASDNHGRRGRRSMGDDGGANTQHKQMHLAVDDFGVCPGLCVSVCLFFCFTRQGLGLGGELIAV